MMLKFVVLAALACVAYSKPDELNKDNTMSKEELQRYFGVESHDEAPEYEIVYPYIVEAEGKRSVGKGATAAEFLELEVDAFGETLTLLVHHDDSNYAPGLEVEIFTDEGVQNVPLRTDCIYTGKVAGEKRSIASVTTCDGLMAVIHRNSGLGNLYIERLDDEHAVKRDVGFGHPHVAYKNVPVQSGDFCETVEPPVLPDQGEPEPPILPIDTQATKYVELGFIADKSYTTAKGSTATATTCVNALFNAVKNVLQLSSIRGTSLVPKLTYIKIFGASESGLTSSTVGLTYLQNCRLWQNTNNPSGAKHWDNAVFLTNIDITKSSGSTGLLGIAYIGQCDNTWAAALSEFRSLHATAVTAHEIGHNLGMWHDSEGPSSGPNNNCPSSGFLMAAYVESDHRKDLDWSTCSRSYYDTRITQTTCYNDA